MTNYVKGIAPSNTKDLERITEGVRAALGDVSVEQLPVTHVGDDDGIWFFRAVKGDIEVQIESSTGACPFLVENGDGERYTALTAEDAIETIVKWLST